MIQDLKILNGELSLKFDELQTKYTVTVTEAEALDFDYTISEGVTVEIKNNDLNISNEVNLIAKKDGNEVFYTFYVVKNDPVINISDNYQLIDVETNRELPIYVAPLIGSSIFLILLIFFSLLFQNKRFKK